MSHNCSDRPCLGPNSCDCPCNILLGGSFSFQAFIVLLFFKTHVVDTLPELRPLSNGEKWAVIGPIVKGLGVVSVEAMGLALTIFLLLDTTLPFFMFLLRCTKTVLSFLHNV